ncbi:hypothetical protein A1O3_04619 [Capronia epimyces CBS 606.96]|uniref:Major facilitator superfamily (MFS) profile domain-containing protein n=1 Tax=Capronia epimyces CBS 606.96 TaxID=1182542 RepID=W9XTT6_9EURO|nr:uncharacterized protein A1O3_04619 [Capronia epimyces CBS 606.96]EXJ83952.1 hypothetical protein A1O3_04619 [Capronia epimyces CBS 606.96]
MGDDNFKETTTHHSIEPTPSDNSDLDDGIASHIGDLGREIDSSAIGGNFGDMPKGYYWTLSFLGTLIGTCLGISCFKLGYVLPVNTLSIINADIGPDPSVAWIATGWNLSAAIGYTLVGRLSDIYGRRWFFIGGNVIGLLSAVVGATAKNIPTLIGSSVLAGLAASVQLSFPTIIGELIPNKHRGVANGLILVTAVPFSVFGPVVARSFVLHTSQGWRWSYYLNIIMSGIVVCLYFLFYHPPTYRQLHARRLKEFKLFKTLDFGGAILFSLGLALFLLGMSWGGQSHPWKSGEVIGSLIGGVVSLVAFFFYEIYMPHEYPFIPMRLFRNLPYVTTALVGCVGAMIYYSANVLWPTEVAKLYETGLLDIGWLSMTVGGGTLAGQYAGALLCHPLGKHKWQLIVGSVAMTGFIGGLAAADSSTRALATAMTTLGSFAVGYVELVVLTTAPLCLPQEDLGLATGVAGAFRSASGAIATAIYATILNNKLTTNISKYVRPAALDAGLPASELPKLITALGTGNFTAVPDLTPGIGAAASIAYKIAYSQSFKTVYLASLAFGGLSTLSAIATPNMEKYFNTVVARRLHGKDIAVVEKKKAQEKVQPKVEGV